MNLLTNAMESSWNESIDPAGLSKNQLIASPSNVSAKRWHSVASSNSLLAVTFLKLSKCPKGSVDPLYAGILRLLDCGGRTIPLTLAVKGPGLVAKNELLATEGLLTFCSMAFNLLNNSSVIPAASPLLPWVWRVLGGFVSWRPP